MLSKHQQQWVTVVLTVPVGTLEMVVAVRTVEIVANLPQQLYHWDHCCEEVT